MPWNAGNEAVLLRVFVLLTRLFHGECNELRVEGVSGSGCVGKKRKATKSKNHKEATSALRSKP